MTAPINQFDARGRRHGVWENHRENGTLRWREHYLHGEQHGSSEGYWSDGTHWWRRHYLHGELRGFWEWYRGHLYVKTYYLRIK